MSTRSALAACGTTIATLAFAVGPPALGAQELHVDQGAQRVVRFRSRTQLDSFEGITERIDGYLVLRGGLPSAAPREDDSQVYFEVDLAGLTTGIGLRDRHMRDNYLEVKKYPYASFRGRIAGAQARGDGATTITAAGAFTVHGVSREREITCDVGSAGAGYTARCAFPVMLSDHDIDIPRVMFLKLANEIQVEVEFIVSPPAHERGNP